MHSRHTGTIFTDRTTEGYVFTGVCLFGGEGGGCPDRVPVPDGGYPNQVPVPDGATLARMG